MNKVITLHTSVYTTFGISICETYYDITKGYNKPG